MKPIIWVGEKFVGEGDRTGNSKKHEDDTPKERRAQEIKRCTGSTHEEHCE
jgi:hypothetical protein